MIALGQVVFDPDRHLPESDPMPKRNDAKARMDYVMRIEFEAPSNGRLRNIDAAETGLATLPKG